MNQVTGSRPGSSPVLLGRSSSSPTPRSRHPSSLRPRLPAAKLPPRRRFSQLRLSVPYPSVSFTGSQTRPLEVATPDFPSRRTPLLRFPTQSVRLTRLFPVTTFRYDRSFLLPLPSAPRGRARCRPKERCLLLGRVPQAGFPVREAGVWTLPHSRCPASNKGCLAPRSRSPLPGGALPRGCAPWRVRGRRLPELLGEKTPPLPRLDSQDLPQTLLRPPPRGGQLRPQGVPAAGLRWCCRRAEWPLKAFPQPLHMKRRSALCILWWMTSEEFLQKALSQWPHL